MSNLSQEQKTKVNNFLRSLNQRITNFIEEMIDESVSPDQNKNGEGRGVNRQIGELDQLLDELQNPQSVPDQKPTQKKHKRDNRRRDDRQNDRRQDRDSQQRDQKQKTAETQTPKKEGFQGENQFSEQAPPVIPPPAPNSIATEPPPITGEIPVAPDFVQESPAPLPTQVVPEILPVEPVTQEPVNVPAPEQNIAQENIAVTPSEPVAVPTVNSEPIISAETVGAPLNTESAITGNPPQEPAVSQPASDYSQISNLLDRVAEKQD